MADPLLLLVLAQGQQEHVPRRRHVVVYWREKGGTGTADEEIIHARQ